MVRDSSGYPEFKEVLLNKIEELTDVALNPKTDYGRTQSSRVRLKQLKEVLSLAEGETDQLP